MKPDGKRLSSIQKGAEALAFFEKVVLKFDGTDCLKWPYSRNNYGYARITIRGSRLVASRVVCERTHGPPASEKMEAAHICGMGHEGCVNPRHIVWKTRIENQADKKIHGTTNQGERCGNAKLTENQVREIRVSSENQRVLAGRYGVFQATISKIIRRERWEHVHD